MYNIFRKIFTKILSHLHPHQRGLMVDYIDAPVLKATPTLIPVGKAHAYTHNYEPAHNRATVEEVHLGSVTIDGKYGRIRQRGIWLMEFSWYGGQSFLSPSYQGAPPEDPKQKKIIFLEGVVTSTQTFFGSVYGHALLDELPILLNLLENDRYRTFDTILCGNFAFKLLNRISTPNMEGLLKRIRIADPTALYHCAKFISFRRTGCCKNPSLEELKILQHYALDSERATLASPRQFFIKRESITRKIENWSEIEKILINQDIDIVLASTISNPWRYFANADLVIGVSGSDLSDSCFMTQGAKLIEIIPTDHVQPYNWNVAKKLRLKYYGILAKSKTERGTPLGPGNSSIYLDPTEFSDLIIRLKPLTSYLIEGHE